MKHIVIIGNGITGITCARHIRKQSNDQITVISSESRYFYSRTALMYIFMGHMTLKDTQPYEPWFWEKNRISLVHDYVSDLDPNTKKLTLEKGGSLSYNQLVLATGSRPNKFGWPGQDLDGVQGLYSLQDLEMLEKNSRNAKRAVIVGGGLIGVELAEMLNTRHIKTTFLVRESHYWGNILPKEEGLMVARHMTEDHHIVLKLETNLQKILGDKKGKCRAVVTDEGEEIPCDIVGLTAGVSPNLDLAKKAGIPTNRGILVDSFLRTSVPDVFAAGDCAEIIEKDQERGKVEQLWYTGRMQAVTLANTLCGQSQAYDRGIWFNSAKFFDIEYHTYGFVPNSFDNPKSTFYWEHENGRIGFRLVFEPATLTVTGMNSFGIRYRHRVFEAWIREKRTAEYVLTHLKEANFDPEMFRSFEPQIVAYFNKIHHKQLVLKKARPSFFLKRLKPTREVDHA